MNQTFHWGQFTLHRGENLDLLRAMPDASVDSVVTDPPYGLRFMGKRWDYDVPDLEVWSECLRVLKPGGYLLAFAGTRTQHRMAVRIEDAGFEIRDMIAWVYGSGFPKSHNGPWGGTALKPAFEPITVARKPPAGTVADNVLTHGTGALNIDACRVHAYDSQGYVYVAQRMAPGAEQNRTGRTHQKGVEFTGHTKDGRWPANLIHDGSDEVLAVFPNAPGQLANVSTTAPSAKTSNVYGRMNREGEPSANSDNGGAVGSKMKPGMRRLDAGSAARFFYCAKASASERGSDNKHPTVKPTDLMRYLCRLVTPPGGVVLDPFMGSGSTGVAAVQEGFRFVGMERDDHTPPLRCIEVAQRRIATALYGPVVGGVVASLCADLG